MNSDGGTPRMPEPQRRGREVFAWSVGWAFAALGSLGLMEDHAAAGTAVGCFGLVLMAWLLNRASQRDGSWRPRFLVLAGSWVIAYLAVIGATVARPSTSAIGPLYFYVTPTVAGFLLAFVHHSQLDAEPASILAVREVMLWGLSFAVLTFVMFAAWMFLGDAVLERLLGARVAFPLAAFLAGALAGALGGLICGRGRRTAPVELPP